MIRSNSQFFIPTAKTENSGKPQIRYLENGEFVNLALDEKTGASIALSIDTSTYVMTVALKNADGKIISSGNIDFPLESVVVNATYKNGILTLVLQNGNSVNVDISDIISGLVAEDGDGSNLTASFTESATRTNITTGEKLSVLFGKIKKWFTDLKSLAFKSKTEAGDYTAGSITSTDTDSTIAKTSDLSGLVSDVQANGVSVVSNRVANITKSSLGLGNVNNTADVNKVVHGATVLTNQDLNNYNTASLVGWYYAAGGNSVTNKPSGVGDFGLEVVRAANGVFVQRLTNRDKIYQRTYLSPSWSSWEEFANTTGTYSGMTVGNATNATNAINATNATNDSNGQKIVDTYAKKTEISNPNLLINPDFSINQRGASSYNTKRQYTCDRWELYSAAGTTYNASTKTFTVASDGGYFWYEQYSEIDAVLLRGKSLTFTLSASGGISRRISFGYKVDSTKIEIAGKDTTEASTKISVTGTVPNDATGIIYVRIQGFNTTGTITLEWAKLEVGSVETAFIPPLIAEELPKCQRYYQKFSGMYSSFGSGFFNDTELACIWVKPNVTMSGTATAILNGTVYLDSPGKLGYDGTQSAEIGANPITQTTTEKFYIPFTVSGAPTGAAIGAAMFMDDTSSLEFDAEIY